MASTTETMPISAPVAAQASTTRANPITEPPMSVPSLIPTPTTVTDAKVPADPAVVCVPMILNAFVLNETLCNSDRKSKIGPLNLPDYSGLGHGSLLKADVVPPVDLHAASPASINTRISDVAGTGAVRTDRLGVYLHWILPKAFRAGMAATESASKDHDHDARRLEAGLSGKKETSSEDAEFRPVPDRWFVFRLITNAQHADGDSLMDQDATAVKAFAIESNRIRKIADFGPDEDIETEATPFLDLGPNQGSHMQQDTFMGFKTDLEGWTDGALPGSAPNDKKYHSPLTVVDSSNPLFPDYQPHNANVFSLHDDLTYLKGGRKMTLKHAQVSYFVFGYYSNETQDPFFVDPKAIPAGMDAASWPTNTKILEKCFMELRDKARNANWLESPASKSKLVCHGAMYNVVWDIAKVPNKVPAENLAQQFENSHPVAVGVDMMDALEAYLEAHADDKQPSLVHSVAALLESKQGDIHQLRQASKDLLRNRYNKTSGGAHWYLSKEKFKPAPSSATGADVALKTPTPLAQAPTPSKAKDEPPKPPTAARFSKVAVALVHELNALQAQLDACLRHRDQLQFLLFCEWWKERAEPSSHETDSTKEQDSRKANIKKRVASLTSELVKLGDPKAGDGKIGEIEGKINLLREHPSLTDQLKSGAGASFFARKDPSVVLIGPRSPWPNGSSSEALEVRLSSQIPLYDSAVTLEKRRTLPKGWENVLKDAPQPKGLIETLGKATEPTFNAGSIVEECLPEVKAWLLSWSRIQKMKSDKAPTSLQDALDHLLVEWVFLSGDTYASIDTLLPPNYLKAEKDPQGAAKQATEQPLFDGRIHWNNSQAWFPLFVEWEVEYFHVPIDKWEIREEADGTIIGAIDRQQQLSSIKGIRNDVRVLTGRSLLQPQVSQTLKTQLEEVLKQSTPEDESKEAKVEKQEVLELLGDLPFLSTSLTGITDHLLTLVEGSHVAPHKDDIPGPIFSADTLTLLDGATTDVSPYGRYLDIQHHRRDGKDSSHSPFKPVTHGQVRFTKLNIIDKFGQVVPALSPRSQDGDQYFTPLRPYTSKSLSCQPDPVSGPYFSNTVIQDPEGLCQFFQLSPSINQDSRLNACFVVADDVNARFGSEKIPAETVSKMLHPADHSRSKSSWRPVTEHENPIWGWAVVNFRDGGLQIYDGNGVFRAEALLRERKVYWLPPQAADFAGDEQSDDSDSDDDDPETTANVASTQLDFFLEALKSAAYLKTLMDVIIRALDSLHPTPNSFSGEVAAVFGRPLALVNMAWSLELATQPMKDQSTFSEQSSSGISVLDYDFTLRMGDRHNLNDGLVGYFEEVGSAARTQRNPPIGAGSTQANGTKGISSAEPNTSTKDINGTVNGGLAPFDFSCLCTEFGEKSDPSKTALKCDQTLTTLRPYFINPLKATVDDYSYLRNQVMSVFAAIVDPFSDIFGYSMVLPPRKLQIPRWTIEKAMKQMTPFMSVGPVLVPDDIPDPQVLQMAQLGSSTNGINGAAPAAKKDDKDPPTIPAHIPADGGWSWLQPVAVDDNAEEVEFLKINVRKQESKFQELNGPHTAVGGYLQLTTQPTPALVSSSKVHRAVDIGKFMGDDSLSLRLSGRGSCGGYAGETVEVAITLERVQGKGASGGEKTKKANIERKLNKYSILVDLPSEKTRLKEARSPSAPIVFNTPMSVTYTRPLREYTLEVMVVDEETGLMFPTQLQIPVSSVDPTKVVGPSATNPTPTASESSVQPRAKILSARFSSLKIDGSVTVGQPLKGTLVLRDTRNNVCTGYDDRACIQFEDEPKPAIVSNSDSYSLTFPPFTEKGDKEIWAFIADQLIGNQPTKVHVLPDLNLDRCITRGSGFSNGLANEAVSFELMLLDRKGSTIKDLDLKVAITAQSSATPIPSQVVKASSQNAWTSVTYARPAVGSYSVAITAEEQHVPGSPFQLQSTATPVVCDLTKTAVEFGGQNNQQVKIVLKDSADSPYHASISDLQQLCLVASSIPPAEPIQNIIPLKSEYNDGTFEAALSLPPGSEWTFSVQSQLKDGKTAEKRFPGSTAVSKSGQLVSKPSVIQKICASGDGLHSGKESSTAIVSIKCIDQTSQEVACPRDAVTVAITNQRGGSIPYAWTADNQISFTRPSAEDSPCFVRIWLERSKSDVIEAIDSPFNVRILKASTSEVETAGSCSFLTMSHTIGKSSHATAVVLDKGGKRRMIPSKVVVISDNDSFQIMQQNPLPNPDGTHSFSYIPKTPLITFDCIIDNAVKQTCTLPSAPPPKITLGVGAVAIYPQEAMQIVSRIPFASGELKARDFRATLYPTSVGAKQQCYAVTVRHIVSSEGRNYLRLEAEGMADLQRIPYTLRLTYQGRVLSTIGVVVTTSRPL